jgi:tetratricopeptide (TPR) repeat protein
MNPDTQYPLEFHSKYYSPNIAKCNQCQRSLGLQNLPFEYQTNIIQRTTWRENVKRNLWNWAFLDIMVLLIEIENRAINRILEKIINDLSRLWTMERSKFQKILDISHQYFYRLKFNCEKITRIEKEINKTLNNVLNKRRPIQHFIDQHSISKINFNIIDNIVSIFNETISSEMYINNIKNCIIEMEQNSKIWSSFQIENIQKLLDFGYFYISKTPELNPTPFFLYIRNLFFPPFKPDLNMFKNKMSFSYYPMKISIQGNDFKNFQIYANLITNNPNPDSYSLYQLGLMHKFQKNYKKALDLFMMADRLSNLPAGYSAAIGGVLFYRQEFNEALPFLLRADERLPIENKITRQIVFPEIVQCYCFIGNFTKTNFYIKKSRNFNMDSLIFEKILQFESNLASATYELINSSKDGYTELKNRSLKWLDSIENRYFSLIISRQLQEFGRINKNPEAIQIGKEIQASYFALSNKIDQNFISYQMFLELGEDIQKQSIYFKIVHEKITRIKNDLYSID